MQFLLGFATGAVMVALLARQYLKGYREGIRCAAKASVEEALNIINHPAQVAPVQEPAVMHPGTTFLDSPFRPDPRRCPKCGDGRVQQTIDIPPLGKVQGWWCSLCQKFSDR